jgi:hypothetical protein
MGSCRIHSSKKYGYDITEKAREANEESGEWYGASRQKIGVIVKSKYAAPETATHQTTAQKTP